MAIWVQKTRIRLYQDQNKIIGLQGLSSGMCQARPAQVWKWGSYDQQCKRIAVGAPDMRNKLITEGKLVSYGIYFDVNKDVVKPDLMVHWKSIADIPTRMPV